MRSLLLLVLVGTATSARAAFEDLGAGARAAGMGNAFTAVADDVHAAYYNPAGLSQLQRPELGTSYSVLYPGLDDSSNLAASFVGYAQPLEEGRKGTLAASWNSLSLGSLYRDDAIGLSYGRRAWGDLSAGATLKYLRSSFGSFTEASNAVPAGGLVGGGQRDPVLSGRRTMGALDADVGLLYRLGRSYSFGLQAAHVNQPNVAFDPAAKDTLPLSVKLGFGYRSLLSNLAGEYGTTRAPDGGRDQTFALGAERWFPKLLTGDFGVRAGVGLGTRERRELSLGGSYRTRRFGADYAFLLPFGGMGRVVGAHRVGLTFRFGSAQAEEESVELLLEAMRQLKAGQAPQTRNLTVDEFLAQARAHESRAEYAKSVEAMGRAMSAAPAGRELLERFGRLSWVAAAMPSLPAYKIDPAQAQLHVGLVAYLSGDSVAAIRGVAAAAELKPDHKELQIFLAQLEVLTGVKRPESGKVDYVAAMKLTQANSAVEEGRYAEAVELSLAVLRVEPENAAAWQNLGTAYFALGDYTSSLAAWRKAYALEKSPAIRSAIKVTLRSIAKARRKPRAQAVPEARPLPERPNLSQAEKDELYQRAVDAYTGRDFPKAKALLEKILEADPENVEVQKALQRVKDELP